MAFTTNKHNIATFIDGVCRATLIPFAPFLIALSTQKYDHYYHEIFPHVNQDTLTNYDMNTSTLLLNNNNLNVTAQIHDLTNTTTTTLSSTITRNLHENTFFTPTSIPNSRWPTLSYFTSFIIATYLIGRIIGMTIANHSKIKRIFYETTHNSCNKAYSTIVGTIIALQFFSFGLGYNHNFFKIWSIRLFMGIFNGIIQRISGTHFTNNINSTKFLTNVIQSSSSSSITTTTSKNSTTAKIWLLGFGLSTVTSGIFYFPIHHSRLYTFLANKEHSLSSFFVSLFIFGSIVYATRMVFDWFLDIQPNARKNDDDDLNNNYQYGNGNSETNHKYAYNEGNYDDNEIMVTTNMIHTNDGNSSLLKRRKGGYANDSGENQGFSTQFVPNQEHSTPQFNRTRLGSYHSNVSDVFFDCESNFGDSFEIEFNNNNYNSNGDDYDNNENDEEMNLIPEFEASSTSESVSNHRDNPTQSSGEVAGLTISNNNNNNINRNNRVRWKVDNSNSIAKYVDGKCVFDDGSPSHVPAGLIPSKVPLAFEKFFKSKAEEKWEETKQWRKEQKIYKIHARPHTLFPRIKEAYPHFIHGYSKLGYPVVYESPAKMKLKDMFRDGHTIDDMVYHYMFFLEFLSNHLSHQRPELQEALKNRPQDEKNGDWGFVVVMDMSGLGVSVFSGAVLQYLQKAGNVNNSHYPNTTTLGLLVNAPFWLSGVWGNIKPYLPKSAKFDLIGASNVTEGLRKYIDDDQIPKEFGGSSPYAIDQHPYEREMHSLVEQTLLRDDDDENDDENDDSGIQQEVDQNEYDHDEKTHTNASSFHQIHDSHESHDIEAGRNLAITSPQELTSQNTVTFAHQPLESPRSPGGNRAKYSEIECTFFKVSVIYWLSCAVQGSLEITLPFWLLVPKELGGLGYQTYKCCISIFLSSMMVIWLLGTSRAKNISTFPCNFPLRGFRIGIGSNSISFVLLPFIPWIYRDDKVLVLIFNVLCVVSIFVSMMIARSSSAALHSIASLTYHDKLSLSCDNRTLVGNTINTVANFVKNGGLTWTIGTAGELSGVLVASPFIAWSLDDRHKYPFNAVFSFHTSSVLCVILYTLSLSLRFNFEETNSNNKAKCSLITNTLATTASDVSALIEGTTDSNVNTIRNDADMKRKV